eukprot:gene17285-26547_t
MLRAIVRVTTSPLGHVAALRQQRWKPKQPLRWPNERTMRHGLKQVCQPWEIRNDPDFIEGDFGLVTTWGGHLTERQLENAMINFKNRVRVKEYEISVRDEQQLFPQNRRPQGARMGKGIGDNVQWVMKYRAGSVVFDVKARSPHAINEKFIAEFFRPVQDMLAIATRPARHGYVDLLDDINYRTATTHMDPNYFRRLQDAYPDIAHNKHYYQHARLLPEAPFWDPK